MAYYHSFLRLKDATTHDNAPLLVLFITNTTYFGDYRNCWCKVCHIAKYMHCFGGGLGISNPQRKVWGTYHSTLQFCFTSLLINCNRGLLCCHTLTWLVSLFVCLGSSLSVRLPMLPDSQLYQLFPTFTHPVQTYILAK